MLGDELLCQYWSGGEVVIYIDLMNLEGARLKQAAWRDWANYFLILFISTLARADCVG